MGGCGCSSGCVWNVVVLILLRTINGSLCAAVLPVLAWAEHDLSRRSLTDVSSEQDVVSGTLQQLREHVACLTGTIDSVDALVRAHTFHFCSRLSRDLAEDLLEAGVGCIDAKTVASHTTDAGLGLSFTGQLGMGGGGGVSATRAPAFSPLCGRAILALAFAALWAPMEKLPAALETALRLNWGKEEWRQEERLRASHTAIQKMGRCGIAVWRMCAWESAPRGCATPGRAGLEPPHCIRLSVAVERSYSF